MLVTTARALCAGTAPKMSPRGELQEVGIYEHDGVSRARRRRIGHWRGPFAADKTPGDHLDRE